MRLPLWDSFYICTPEPSHEETPDRPQEHVWKTSHLESKDVSIMKLRDMTTKCRDNWGNKSGLYLRSYHVDVKFLK